MIRMISLGTAIAVVALGAPDFARAQTRTLDAFVAEANRVPMNATAAFRPSARRLLNEGGEAMRAVIQEARAARAAGRPTGACPPEGIEVDARQLLGFFNAIPQPRRARMSVRDGFREWLASRHPCR